MTEDHMINQEALEEIEKEDLMIKGEDEDTPGYHAEAIADDYCKDLERDES